MGDRGDNGEIVWRMGWMMCCVGSREEVPQFSLNLYGTAEQHESLFGGIVFFVLSVILL